MKRALLSLFAGAAMLGSGAGANAAELLNTSDLDQVTAGWGHVTIIKKNNSYVDVYQHAYVKNDCLASSCSASATQTSTVTITQTNL